MADGGFLGAFKAGAENLANALGGSNWGVLGHMEQAPPKTQQPDGIQWVPKFEGDRNGFNPLYGPSPFFSPFFSQEDSNAEAVEKGRGYVIYSDGNGRMMKVDSKTGKVLWRRWVT